MLRSFGSWLPCTSGMFGTSKRVSPFSSRCGAYPEETFPGTIVLVEAPLDESSRSVCDPSCTVKRGRALEARNVRHGEDNRYARPRS